MKTNDDKVIIKEKVACGRAELKKFLSTPRKLRLYLAVTLRKKKR